MNRKLNAYTVVAAIVKFYLLGALAISFSHIVHASAMLGLTGWQAWTVPFFIDGFALLGMIGRTDSVASRTEDPAAAKRFGFRLQGVAGLLSLAANVYAGDTVGARAFGALVVIGFVIAEKYSEKLRKAPAAPAAEQAPQITAADVQAAVDAALAAERAQHVDDLRAAGEAAIAQERKRAERAAARQRKAAERAAAEAAVEAAPISPAGPLGLIVPTAAELRAAVYAIA